MTNAVPPPRQVNVINPYESPATLQDTASNDWEPNTWLTNWSLTLILVFVVTDTPFALRVFRDSPGLCFLLNVVAEIVILIPLALMLYVDGIRAVRAAPIRVFCIVLFSTLHITFSAYFLFTR